MRSALAVAVLVLGACGNPAPTAAPAEPLANTAGAEAPVDVPSLAIVLVVDRSGSMMGMKLDETRAGAALIAADLPAGAELAVIAFDTVPVVLVPLTHDPEVFATGIAKLEAGGGTQFLPALIAARELLAGSDAARKHVVFLSDGQAAYDGVEDAARALLAGGATVSTVAIPDADQALLALISSAGGGRAIVLPDAAGLAAALASEVRRLSAP